MPQLPAAAEGPQYKELGPPFKMNEDDALSNLTENEYPVLRNVVEHQKQLYPIVDAGQQIINGGDTLVSQFTLPDAAQVNILFTSAGKMYYASVALPGSATLTEITVAGGSTAITADGSNASLYSVAYVNGALYFAHDGTGVLRVWGGGATYADVAAPGSGYHNAVKYKPYYLTAQNNRLIILGDAAAAVGTQYDVVGSTTTNAADFVSFGAFYTQLLDTTDKIAGGSTLYGKLIIYKKDSIIVATASGDASAPYNFERYQQSTEQSVGLFAPYTLQNDGGFRDIFMSRYGMVMFDGSNFQMIGAGVDNAIMGQIQAGSGGGITVGTPAQATLGTFYTQGTALPTTSVLNGTNKPQRFYALITLPGAALNGVMYLFNVDKGVWSKATGPVTYAAGVMFTANTDSNGNLAPTAQKCLVYGNARLNILSLAVNSTSKSANFNAPLIQIGSGPAIYGVGPHLQKTVARVGIGFQYPIGATTTAFSVTATVFVSGSNASAGGMVPSTTTPSVQVAIPAITTTTNVEQFAWIDIDSTCRSPIVQIAYPDDATARFWPRITRLVVQFTLGGDS